MSASKLILIRHARTAENAQGIMQGHLDVPLDDIGRRQAERLAERLADWPIDALYTSDLARAFDTAEPIGRALGIVPVARDKLREVNLGVFQGLTRDEAAARFPEAYQDRFERRDPDARPPGGESYYELQTRVMAEIDRIVRDHLGRTVAVVTHGGCVNAFLVGALGLTVAHSWRFRADNASITALERVAAGWALSCFNDRAHLEGEPELVARARPLHAIADELQA